MDSLVLDGFAAEAAVSLLERVAPEVGGVVSPFVDKLFAALAEGHSFIWLDKHDIAALKQARPVVGGDAGSPLILRGNKLFLGKMWQLEQDLARQILRIAAVKPEPVDWLNASHHLADWFSEPGSRDQKAAAALALLQNFMVISGGPGTGKTTTVAKLLALLCVNAGKLPRIALVAPTGKAAAHMAKALHRALGQFNAGAAIKAHLEHLEGQTVHRLLKFKPPYMQPAYHADNPLPLDMIVVDEASMLDTALLLQLLSAVPDGCRVIILGDENQLPSVGAGAVLAALARQTVLTETTAQELTDLLPEQPFAVSDRPDPLAANIARLTISHRFGEYSGIGCLARAVVQGNVEDALAQFERFPNEIRIHDMNIDGQLETLYRLQQNYWQAVAQNDVKAAFGHQADCMVLAAWRNNAEHFNQAYQAYLKKIGIIKQEEYWFAGQMLMVSRNDYTLDLFNGDIGLVLRDDASDTGALAAYFPDGDEFRKIALSRLPECETAFAMTVHKSQGSEYKEVWLLPPMGYDLAKTAGAGLNRALLYTAITRARERFVFLGKTEAFKAACLQEETRRSAVREMLAEG
ncbi:exodeoxyribonuclease V subunit alpha [Neisseria wadsworthii]|uniref:RecBCD enzyme subunit RecD n=1 Tax=Neisseria wadsworthii 9715 TaxID=1030841 RepID=G4CRW5_9NEIS|nr:exodeoxyribonuclease V subunit alpha [Neisseria wadsworthii]EGZ44879.1 exodeoxyribonuclease V alpha subunit [Neisseria wadsworthii 9715]QMT35488.1 exodeoxyribonuclease V subunit alpha [Neisseria wadsworthii]